MARLPTPRSPLGDLGILRLLSFYPPVCETVVVGGPVLRVLVAGAQLMGPGHPHVLQMALSTAGKSVLFET